MIETFAANHDVDIQFETVVIKTDLDATLNRYLGSPTIRINSLDVDPTARSATQFGFG